MFNRKNGFCFILAGLVGMAFTSCLALSKQPESSAHKQKVILVNFKNDMLQHNKTPWGVTAFSAVSQCKNDAPIVVYDGTTSRDGKIPINQNSLFQVGSVTKSFISVVMLQVSQEYKINLDSEKIIATYFPQYPKWGKVTIRQLLNMTSGIPDNSKNGIYRKFTAHEFHNYISPTQILNLKYKLSMDFKPGTRYEYSNTNYTLLGLLIQKITHHSAEYEVKNRIFEKLHLQHTYFPENKLQTIPGINQTEIVHGYDYYRKGYHPLYSFMKYGQDVVNFSVSWANTAGAIVSTPGDINHYIHALYTPGVLLSKKQLNEFTTLNGYTFTPPQSDYKIGYGLGVFGFYSKKLNSMLYWYQGEMLGYQFVYLYNPKTQQYLTFGINTNARILNINNVTKLFYQLNAYCKN